MSGAVTLHGYRFSVYTRIARAVLHEKAVPYGSVEVDPFAEPADTHHLLHPFGRVPVLTHGSFALYETSAISRYIDGAFPARSLVPDGAGARARMDQVISVVDSYGYWPMIRQVFEHRVFRPLAGEAWDEGEIALGLAASLRVLGALEAIAREGLVLDGQTITLTDCYLAPMLDYFARAEEGRVALAAHPALSAWWEQVRGCDFMQETDPDLSGVSMA